jgi:hypothetical protein
MSKLEHVPAETANRKRSLLAALLSLPMAIGLLAFAPTAAQAEAAADHCVYNLTRDELTCAGTQTAALAADRAAADEAGVQATTVLIRLYDRTNYDVAGGTRTFVVDGSYTCSAAYSPIEFSADYLDAAGWSNRASSVHTYRSCDIRLFDGVAFNGSVSTWIDNVANLATVGGGWSNRAGSYQIS